MYDQVGKLGDKNLVPEFGTFVLAEESQTSEIGPELRPFLNRNLDEVENYRTVQVRHGAGLLELPVISERSADDAVNDQVDAAMREWGMVGFLAVHDGKIVHETYRCGNTADSRSVVHSVTKSFTSTLIAGAIADGHLDLDTKISAYIEQLQGTEYGDCTLRSIMNMSAGMKDPNEANFQDAMQQRRKTYRDTRKEAVIEWLSGYQRYAAPGEVYEYVDYNFYLQSEILRRTYGKTYEQLLAERIWVPAGMQHDGFIRTTHAGDADGHGGLSMTLRDMARFGLFVLQSFSGSPQPNVEASGAGGAGSGDIASAATGPHVPEGWFQHILDAAKSTEGVRAPGNIPMAPEFGYELGWWPHRSIDESGNERLCFSAQGVFGQTVFVYPDRNAIVVTQAAGMMHDGATYAATQVVADAVLRAAGA